MELTLDEVLHKGAEAQRAGEIEEAYRFYTAILQAQPKHPDANHNMGILAVSVGKTQEALPFFKTALLANSSIVQFWLSYIDALIRLGRKADAQAVFDQAKGKGVKGKAVDQMEQWLSELADNQQDPPPDQLQSILNLYTQGHLQQAISDATKMRVQFPNSAVLCNIVGASNAGLMQFDAAIGSYQNAIKIKPDDADAYNNMGVALQDKGDLESAIGSYKQALKIKPDHAETYNNMGNALKDKGDLEAAIDSYKQALKIKPDYAHAYINMGTALNDKGDPEAAIDSYKQALKIKPDSAEAYNNIGAILMIKGQVAAAMDSFKQALEINPDFANSYVNMGAALKQVVFSEPNLDMQKVIISILDQKNYSRPIDISDASISLVKFEPAVKELYEKHSSVRVRQSLESLVSNLSEVPLLCKLMSVCPLTDIDLEVALTDVRLALLLSVFEISNSPKVLYFQSALALQCFTNEYIYDQSDKETKALVELESVVEQTLLKGEQPRPQLVLCLATYKALYQYKWCELLTLTASIENVYMRQIIEPKQEHQLKPKILTLQKTTNKVSSKVKEQYEKNPYPRWVNTGLRIDPAPIHKIIKEVRLKLYDQAINDVKAPNILIAGCGTGQHSITTGFRFKNAKVLAVDLSLSSLAYAKRKTDELGLPNIDYMQADILDLSKLDRKFDIIESSGVLHHMDDPMAGWKVLANCLKPGGLMNIGLYSELARQHIVSMREEINQSGIGSSDIAMKSFRNELIKSEKVCDKLIQSSTDFYSLSSLRDLLFHVQEHGFTIPQIKDCLSELGLKFCGFEEATVVRDFQLTNTEANETYDLDKWHFYEEANPRSFASMYQFWCQKVV